MTPAIVFVGAEYQAPAFTPLSPAPLEVCRGVGIPVIPCGQTVCIIFDSGFRWKGGVAIWMGYFWDNVFINE